MAKDLKITVLLKEGSALVGINTPDCDPVMFPVQGDIVSVAAELPALVAQAETKWAQAPKMPASSVKPPAPPAPPPGSATGGGTRAKTKAEEPAKEAQPSWF